MPLLYCDKSMYLKNLEGITIDGSKNKNIKNLSQRTSADKNFTWRKQPAQRTGKKDDQARGEFSAGSCVFCQKQRQGLHANDKLWIAKREVEEKNKRLEIYFSNYRIHSSQSRIFKPVYSWKRGATSVNSTKSRDGKIFEKIRSAKYNNLKKYNKNVVKRWKRKSQVGILDIIEGYESHEHK